MRVYVMLALRGVRCILIIPFLEELHVEKRVEILYILLLRWMTNHCIYGS